MSYTYTSFANDTTPALPDLDENFKLFGVLAPIPCLISGTNDLTLTANSVGQATSLPLAAYENGVQFCGIVVSTNTTSMTARYGALAVLAVYKDTLAGPVGMTGGELVAGNAVTFRYDSALNSGAGGLHVITGAQGVGNTINPSLVRASVGVQIGATTQPTLTALLSQTATLTYTSIVPGSSQDQSFSMAGLSASDMLAFGLPAPASTGMSYSGYHGGGATVTVRALNATAASTLTPGAITVNVMGLRTS